MVYTLSILLVLLFSFPSMAQDKEQDVIIFKAMEDELQRTREQLRLQQAPSPFYVSYTVGRTRRFGVVGSLGAVTTSMNMPWSMQGAVQLFLGDYHRNTNVMEQTMPVNLPIEVDYDAIRRGFWLASDMMYKMSLQLMMKKMTYLKENPLTSEEEALDDWSSIPAVTSHVTRQKETAIDLLNLENIVKELSAVFLRYKELYNTNVTLSGSETDVYKVTSEGVSLKFPLALTTIRVYAMVKVPDGESIADGFSIEVRTPEDLPTLNLMKKRVADFADNLIRLKDAPEMDKFYSGPVMFEDGAVASLFMSNLLQKNVLIANRTFGKRNTGGLSGRINSQIMDKRLSVKNYTTLKTYKDQVLSGFYEMDVEGVTPPSELTLVDHGVFKAMLNGRTPALNAPETTGSSRMAEMATDFTSVTAPGTIHIQVDKGTKAEKMKANLLKAARAKNLEYTYIVRSLAGAASRVFRVDVKTGDEIQVRAVNIPFIPLSKFVELKEISSKERVDNYLWNGRCFSSMIYPSAIIVDNVDISKVSARPEKESELKYPLQR